MLTLCITYDTILLVIFMKNVNDYIEEEKKLMDLEYEFVKDFIKLRKDLHLTQAKMAEGADVIRETIARIENCITSPQINTLIKILTPIGYTIKIVPIEDKE